jgi:Na+/glutamate symporter
MASFVREHRVLFAVLRVVGAIALGILLLMAIVRLAQGQFDWVVLDVIVVVLAVAAAVARVVVLLRESGKKHDLSGVEPPR